jgi:hypothetical protein
MTRKVFFLNLDQVDGDRQGRRRRRRAESRRERVGHVGDEPGVDFVNILRA